MSVSIGYAQEIITPSLEPTVYLAGFGRNRAAQSVHDDLYVRALALEFGETRVVVAALDLIGLGRRHCQEIERRVYEAKPGTRTMLACTHTHHGPDTIGFWGPDTITSGVDPSYLESLKDKVVRAALIALDQIKPATLRATLVRVAGLAKNARDPDILDEELSCLQFCCPDRGAPMVTWLIFPCHPEVLCDQNPHITSDYFDALRRAVETKTSAPCLAMVGAIGGMMTPDVEEHSFAEARNMGRSLAHAAMEVLDGVPSGSVKRLAHMRQEYTVPVTNPLFLLAMENGLLPDLRIDRGTVCTEANLLRVGPAWLLGVPGELLPDLGLAFKEKMRENGARVPVVVGLTNDELGYILPQEVFVYPDDPFAPGEHYEETMSIGPEAGPRLNAALATLLARK